MIKWQLPKFKRFFYVNFFAIAFLEIFFILFRNKNNQIGVDNLKIVGVMILISALIITIQYPILTALRNWIYKAVIFYLSMILFLFGFGIIFRISELGNYTLADLLESGLKMTVLGQTFGGLIMYIMLLILNWKLREDLF